MIGVRHAGPEDIPVLVAMAQQMQAESPVYAPYPFEPDVVARWGEISTGSDDWLCLIAEDEEQGPVGMLIVGCVPMLFCRQQMVEDIAFYVKPQWRGTTAALRLMRTLEPWAKARGAVSMRMGITTGTNPEAAIRFLERFGFTQTGVLLSKTLS